MATSYPGGIDVFTTHVANETVGISHVNNLQDAVSSIETTLGTNSAGSAASVAGRITNVEAAPSQSYNSGTYYNWIGPVGTQAGVTWTAGYLFVVPKYFGKAQPITWLGTEVTTAGTAGAVIRVGVYTQGALGQLQVTNNLTLVADSGALPATTTGVKGATVSATIPVGWAWAGVNIQVANVGIATINNTYNTVDLGSTSAPSTNWQNPISRGTTVITSGALPATLATPTVWSNIPRVYFQAG